MTVPLPTVFVASGNVCSAVVNVFVALVAVPLPSLTVAYHSYGVPAVRPDQVTVALEPEATVVVPTTAKGAELSCIL